MKMLKRAVAAVLFAALLCTSTALAAGEFVFGGFGMGKGLKNCPYNFTDGANLSDWAKFGGKGAIDTGHKGTLKVNYEKQSGTKWTNVYITLSDGNFTENDMGTYKIKFRINAPADKFAGAALSVNQWSRTVNKPIEKLSSPDSDGWTTLESELTINNANKSKFENKPVMLIIAVAESATTQNDDIDNFVYEVDDIVVTKEDTSSVISGNYIVTADIFAKTEGISGSFDIKADILSENGAVVETRDIGLYEYPKIPEFAITLDSSIYEAELYIVDNGAEASDKVKLKRFFRNGQNLISDSGFENGEGLWRGGTVSGAESMDGMMSYEVMPSGTISYADTKELIAAFGEGEYLLEAWVYSDEPSSISASGLSEDEKIEIPGGEWTSAAFLFSDGEISGDGKSFNAELSVNSTTNVYFDNITFKKILNY